MTFLFRALVVVACLAWSSSPAAAAPVVRFQASPIQGEVCVAPCAVHFDAIGDGLGSASWDPDFDRPFHSLAFVWGFRDPSAGTWPISGRSQKIAVGAIAGHVYETPGSYDVGLDVTNPLGQSTSLTSIARVRVADPDVVFAPSRTWCFANSGTPGGDGFEACPVQEPSQHVVIGRDPDGFVIALEICDAIKGKSRCLFRAGDYFGAKTAVRLSNAPGPGLVSRFGSGPNPVVYGADSFVVLRQGWTVAHFEVWLNGGEEGRLFLINSYTSNVTAYDVKAPFLHGSCFSSAVHDAPRHSDLVAMIGVECHVRPTTTGSSVYLRSERTLVMGNWIDSGYEGEFNLRTVHFPRSVIEHNRFERPQDDPGNHRNAIQIRSWAGLGGATSLTGPPPSKTEFVIVSDNVISQDNTPTVIRTCETNTCEDAPSAPGIENLIFERNFFSISTGGGNGTDQMTGALWLQGGDMSVRNNVFDLQGISSATTGALNRFVLHGSSGAAAPGLNGNRIHVLNNAVYYDTPSSNGFEICGGTTGSGFLCRSNLVYVPKETGVRRASSDAIAWGESDNLFAAALPFLAAIPAQGHTRPLDFRPGTSSAAIDLGWDPRTSDVQNWLDFDLRCRPEQGAIPTIGGHFDAGAFESNGALCIVAPEPGTIVLLGLGLAVLARARRS